MVIVDERVIDLNADTGEGYDDAALLRLVTSANMACGGHTGDKSSLRPVVELAVEHGVAVGAQVSYVDREGFGRRRLDIRPEDLEMDLLAQLGLLEELCTAAGGEVSYVKPHGALYHSVLEGGPHAEAVFLVATAHALPLLLMPGSDYVSVHEGFADRAYDDTADGPRLRSRLEPGALITDPDVAAAQAVSLAEGGLRSICVHGDTPGAPIIAAAVRTALEEAGWVLRDFRSARSATGPS